MSGYERRGPGRPGLCDVGRGPHEPGSRLYPCGWRCALHTPAALAGKPETPPGPGWPIHRQPTTDTASPAAGPADATEHEQDPP
ncbi:hypothetical protein [Streptomyces griseosporeus]|uniref:hypothetical protein n=1 Tax=Streptomyces griseosporeus TaxID=1910 RepID=UPI0036FF019D